MIFTYKSTIKVLKQHWQFKQSILLLRMISTIGTCSKNLSLVLQFKKTIIMIMQQDLLCLQRQEVHTRKRR